MVWNEEMLNKWQKVRLENWNTVFMRERKYDKFPTVTIPVVPKKVEEPKFKITVNNRSKESLGRTTFILVNDKGEFLGLCELAIRNDEAGLTTRDDNEFNHMELSEELEEIRDIIQSDKRAIFVHPQRKRQGYGTQLLLIGFN